MKILNFGQHAHWTAGKSLALSDTLSRNTPPELRKTTEEIPQNKKLFLDKDETSPRLEYKSAVTIDSGTKQISNLELCHFT